MSLPVGLSTVTVTCGPYVDAAGEPYSGVVTFTPSTPVAWQATGAVILNGPITVPLDGTGAAIVTLPATDATGLTVSGFTYRVVYALMGADRARTGFRYPFSIQLPHAVPAVELEVLVPVVASDGSTVSVPPAGGAVDSVAGLTGDITTPDLRTALGLASAAYQASSAFDAAGAATAAQSAATSAAQSSSLQRSANLSELTNAATARTNLGLGTAATISTTAGGDLSGTLPAPTVAKVNGVAVTGTPTSGQVITATGSTAATWQTPTSTTPADATTGSKGIVQLAGDLAGTAASPTVPGLTGKAPASRGITAGTGLTGGGDLTADRTLAVSYGTTSGTAAQGNDSRITGALQAASNLSDVANAATARTNLGLGTAATQATGVFVQVANNLSDVTAATARTNLGALGITETVNVVATSGSAQTIPAPTTATMNKYTLTANCTFTLPTAVAGQSFAVTLVQDGTGSRTATFTGAKWAGGTAPTLSTAAGKIDDLVFVCTDATVGWKGYVAGLDMR